MNKIDKLSQFQKLLDGFESRIETFDERKLINKLNKILKEDTSKECDLDLLERKIVEIQDKIKDLGTEKEEKLKNANVIPRILTGIRSFFSHLFFDRDKELERFSPAGTPIVERKFKILKLKGDEGTVECKVRGISAKKIPQLSKFGTAEFIYRSRLRMRNLTAVRGKEEGSRMVGPLDYYGNLERPDKHFYTIQIDDLGRPQILAKRKAGTPHPQTFKESPEGKTTVVDAEWMSGRELKKENKPTSGESLFPNSGILKLGDAHLELKKVQDPTALDLSSFKARLVKNDTPFQITSYRIPASDEYRAVSYHYEGGYAEDQIKRGGGLFLETHTFAQSITPLFNESRGFVTLGKWTEDKKQLELIGIEIPFGYTLIIEKDCIHGDANLKGKFLMTMTSDHTTMQKADTVFLKSAHDLAKNASVSIAGASDDRGDDVAYTGKIKPLI